MGGPEYVTGIDGGLAADVTSSGVELQLLNPHGDVAAICSDSASSAATDNQYEYTESGQARSSSNAPSAYGWLGGDQRSASLLGGMILMGVRFYDGATGDFSSPDQIPGGNNNSYTYPSDSVNSADHLVCWP